MSESTAKDYFQFNTKSLEDYNRSLEKNASIVRLNECFLEEKTNELEKIDPMCEELYWLTFARLNELALLCAGNYADNMEFTSVGDFLVNPRLILVHVKNRNQPVIKERHTKLTEQFQDVAPKKIGVISWLRDETTLEIKEKPLLPYLNEALKNSGYVSQRYLDSADRRLKKIADAVGFFASLNFVDSYNFHVRLQNTPESEKEFIKSNLCKFDTNSFDDLGFDFYQLLRNANYQSLFLK
ncbi:MAG: hypothetical protein JXC33_11070 [Deltaproteobacteria bacterium]|nr:hypothetical protein [Deltaproteobacteria bacterium]